MIPSQLGVVVAFATLILLFWSPMLAMARIRVLFRWPTGQLALNYLVVGSAIIAIQIVSYLLMILLIAGTGLVTGGDAIGIIGGVVAVNLLLPGTIALAALRILPARDYWSPDGDGLNGRIALGIGVVWYAVITSGLFVFIGLVLMFVNMPM